MEQFITDAAYTLLFVSGFGLLLLLTIPFVVMADWIMKRMDR